ncbi:MAG: hypothetical protein IPM94_13085 [bacterium]|nr:hypothetical protein [bacterium]
MRRSLRSWTIIALLALIGCSSEYDPVDWSPTPPSDEAAAFVAQEPFTPLQYTHQIMDWNGIELFVCKFGEGLDCPAGCIYSAAYGLNYGDRVGWIGFDHYHSYEPDSTRFYDFIGTDTMLFDADTWFALMTRDVHACFEMLMPALAADGDTGRGALLTLSTLLYTHESREIAENLVENPSLAEDAEILSILAALPVMRYDMYAAARARAQELLDALGSPGFVK